MKSPKKGMMYPLGKQIFATVKTRAGSVWIQLARFRAPTNTKGGKLVKSGGLSLDIKQFRRLMSVQKRLETAVQEQTRSMEQGVPDYVPGPSSFTIPYEMTAESLFTPGGFLSQVQQPDVVMGNHQSDDTLTGAGEESTLDLVEWAARASGIIPHQSEEAEADDEAEEDEEEGEKKKKKKQNKTKKKKNNNNNNNNRQKKTTQKADAVCESQENQITSTM